MDGNAQAGTDGPGDEVRDHPALIRSLADLKVYFGLELDADNRRLERKVYDCTESGALIEIEMEGIVLWAAIEGSDASTDRHTLLYPFAANRLESALEAVDEQADELWHEANGDGYSETLAKEDRRNYGTSIPPGGRATASDDDRYIPVILAPQPDSEVEYGLRFVLPLGRGHFELVGTLEDLEAMIEDARGLLADERAQLEGDHPDDHPGFDPGFMFGV
jgi:hypothetical protein